MSDIKKIKSSLFERSLSVAKIGLSTGLKYAAMKASGSLNKNNNKNSKEEYDQFITQQAKFITNELGELKGSLMKAGQMLSMYGEYFFPPAANEFLKKLQTDSPPISWPEMKRHLESYFTDEQLDQLEIDPISIGSASMGQVHKAKIKATGEVIALKIQYPGLEKAIDSDIKALKTLLQFSKLIPSEMNLDAVFTEIKSMLHQELDYNLEADLTEKYYRLVGDDTRFKVPRVYREFTNRTVLATEYVEGFKADHALVGALSQKRRNQLAENFLELYFRELFEWNFLQTDPHLGNYKIQIDSLGNDRLVLLDFGACREFPQPFFNSYLNMIRGSVTFNEAQFLQSAKEIGFIIENDPEEYISTFKSFCYETVEPFWNYSDPRNTHKKIAEDGSYHWKDTDLPTRVIKKAMQFKNFDLRSPPQDIIFLDRKTGGVFIFLSVLKAQINGRKLMNKYL